MYKVEGEYGGEEFWFSEGYHSLSGPNDFWVIAPCDGEWNDRVFSCSDENPCITLLHMLWLKDIIEEDSQKAVKYGSS